MADFDINSHLNTMGFGRGKAAGGGDGTNEKSTLDSVVEAGGKGTYTAAKLTGLPVNLSEFGQHGVQKALGGDTEGITGKTIMPSLIPDSQGGFLAKLLHDIFIKNREVTDHTGGTGSGSSGGGGGDFAGGGGGGGDFASSGGFEAFNTMGGGASFPSLATPSHDFDWSPMPMSSLGSISPQATPSGGAAVSAGIDM